MKGITIGMILYCIVCAMVVFRNQSVPGNQTRSCFTGA